MTDTRIPVTIVRAARHTGSLDKALGRDERYSFVSLGSSSGRRFAYTTTPTPHCVMIGMHTPEYGARHLGGGTLSLMATGYDPAFLEETVREMSRRTGIEVYDGVAPTLASFMEASMNGSFAVIALDPARFIEVQQTK